MCKVQLIRLHGLPVLTVCELEVMQSNIVASFLIADGAKFMRFDEEFRCPLEAFRTISTDRSSS